MTGFQKCICIVKEPGEIDETKASLFLGGTLLALVAVGLVIGLGIKACAIFVGLVLLVFVLMTAFFWNDAHDFKCALRRAMLNILTFGTFIF